jgi:hypothetical protein
MRKCSFEGCNRAHDCHGLCKTHNKQIADGKKLTAIKYIPKDPDERFELKLDKSGPCWEWTGERVNGYGRFYVNSRHVYAHRYAYELWVGEIQKPAVVHHKCGVRACCNPDHLQMTTHYNNLAEMFARKHYEARIAELEARIAELEEKAGAH